MSGGHGPRLLCRGGCREGYRLETPSVMSVLRAQSSADRRFFNNVSISLFGWRIKNSEVAFSFFTWRPLVKAYLGAIKSNEAASSHGFDLRGTAHAPAMDGRHRGRPPSKHAARGGRREKPAPQLRIARLGDARARGGLLGCRGWPLVL